MKLLTENPQNVSVLIIPEYLTTDTEHKDLEKVREMNLRISKLINKLDSQSRTTKLDVKVIGGIFDQSNKYAKSAAEKISKHYGNDILGVDFTSNQSAEFALQLAKPIIGFKQEDRVIIIAPSSIGQEWRNYLKSIASKEKAESST